MMTHKIYLILFTVAVLNFSNSYAQKTPEELGQTTFYCFQNNKLDSFFQLIPTIAEVVDFGRSIGIDSSSDQIKNFKTAYPLVINNFKEACMDLLTDSIDLNFSWIRSKLERIEKEEKTLPVDNRYPNRKPVVLTIVSIYFISNDRKFRLTLGDTNKYNGIWKPGNNIDLSVL